MNAARTELFSEWMYSGWLYAGIGVFFAVVLVIMLGLLLRRRKPKISSVTKSNTQTLPLDYPALLEAVSRRNGHTASILMAASSLTDLPITIPVRTAVALAASRKCLLIDLDIKRDALASVFDLDEAEAVPTALKPVSSGIDNLDVWPAHFFARLKQMNLKSLLAEARKTYAVILINVPYLTTHPDRRQIVRCADAAVVFAKDKNALPGLEQILNAGDCRIVKAFHPELRQ